MRRTAWSLHLEPGDAEAEPARSSRGCRSRYHSMLATAHVEAAQAVGKPVVVVQALVDMRAPSWSCREPGRVDEGERAGLEATRRGDEPRAVRLRARV
mgnify:CR=1 FL=1